MNRFTALAQDRRLGLASALAIALVVSLGGLPQADAKKIKIATMAPKGSVFYTVLKDLADEWKTISKGKVKLKIYPGGIAGGDREVIRKIKLGTLHGGLITAAGLSSLDKSINAMQIAFRNYAEADYVLQKMRPSLEATYAERRGPGLGRGGMDSVLSKTPLHTPMTARTISSSCSLEIRSKPTSGKPLVSGCPLPTAEISTALQAGLISALPTTAQGALLLQWFTMHMMDRVWA